MKRWPAWAAVVALVATACSSRSDGERTIVASFYPLAYAAERIAGPGWRVIDLTPPGTEAHDVELSFDDREALATADLVLYLGMNGFQPQVEQAIADAGGVVRGIDDDLTDPHLWVSPRTYLDRVAPAVLEALLDYAPDDDDAGYERRFRMMAEDLEAIDDGYRTTLGDCRHRTLIVSHEAFGYLASDYGLRQFGLAGLEPEGEPTVRRIQAALELIDRGKAGAVFHEPTQEAERVAASVADPADVPLFPLSSLESEPARGDYLSVMRANLRSLREGLGCG